MTKMHDNIAFNDLTPYIAATDPSASIQTDIMHTMSTGMCVEVDFMTPSEIAIDTLLFISSPKHFNYLCIGMTGKYVYVGRGTMSTAHASLLQVMPNEKYTAAMWKQDGLVYFQKDDIVLTAGDTFTTDNYPLCVYRSLDSSSSAFDGRIYEIRTYADWTRQELTHRLIPREDNGEGGLFDTVCNKYYSSNGKCKVEYERGDM